MLCEAAILTTVRQRRVTIAILGVIHDHARCLHQRVTNGRTDERETGLFQTFAHFHGDRRNGRHLTAILEMVGHCLTADERPEEFHRVFKRQPGLRIAPGRIELEPITDDSRIEHQFLYFRIAHLRHALYVKAEQHLTIALTFAQHGDPGKPGLEPFEQKQLEQTLRIA